MPSTSIVSNERILPVTLLSGFLGSGKTTLLSHILKNKQNLKCAVIVNDMASINIDAALVEKTSFLQKEEKLVKFQNGCICCTLRGDLLTEIARLSKLDEFDYLVIESTGISEPMQVAETFAMSPEELAQMQGETEEVPLESLVGIACLDTCVTVVDTSSFYDYFDNAKFLSQQFKNVEQDDDRTVVDLLVDQIEFSDVILLNKMDLVSPEQVKKCEQLIRKLNTHAEIIHTNHSKVDLKKILNTKKFDFERAVLSPGWLQSLKESHVPETLEYGIGSFIFRARRPFHPQRLYDHVKKYFMILENPQLGKDDAEDEEWEDEGSEMDEEENEDAEEEEEDDDDEDDEEDDGVQEEIINERREQRAASAYKGIFRSKGFLWIATRPMNMGEWSQAGIVLTVANGGNWFTELPAEMWPVDPQMVAEIKKDFDKEVGDKRQELVLIGQFTVQDREQIIRDLNSCLVTEQEWKAYKKGKMNDWEDPWEKCDYYSNETEP
jgi:G3E family GTPase